MSETSLMLTTYEATLHGNQIEWQDAVPSQISDGQAVRVHVTVLEPLPALPNRGERMAAILSNLAQSPTLASLDAEGWQREVRADQPLAGREE